MRKILSRCILLIGIASNNCVSAASFDCSKATHQVEKTICANDELSRIDEELARLHESVLSIAQDKAAVKTSQRQWLKVTRNTCADSVCILSAYQQRIDQLKKLESAENDSKVCTGDIKRTLDQAYIIDLQLPDTQRAKPTGQTNDGSLNYGYFWLRSDIAQLYAKNRCWQSSQEVLGKLASDGLKEGNAARLSIEYAKSGQVARALRILDSLKSEEAIAISAYGLAEALATMGRVSDAADVLKRVTTRENHLESPSFQLVRALLKAGRISDAEQVVDQSYHIWNEPLLLADALMKAGKPIKGEQRIAEALEIAKRDQRGGQWTAEDHVNSWATQIYIEGQLFEKARSSASSIQWPLGRLQALLRVAEALHKAGNTAKANETYAEVMKIALSIEPENGSTTSFNGCGYITESYARTGNVQKAFETVAKLCPGRTGTSVSYGYAIKELAKAGHVEKAQQVQAKLDSYGQNDADGPIAVAIARKGDYGMATEKIRGISNEFIRLEAIRRAISNPIPQKVLLEWLEETKSFKHEDMKAATIQVLTAALARSKNVADATKWVESQPMGLAKARGYIGIAQGMMGIVPGAGSHGD